MNPWPLDFARPALLAALLAPALAWWLARRPRTPPELRTGTLSVWREATEGVEPPRARPHRGLGWVRLLALVLAALALAGPRLRGDGGSRGWSLAIDRSPSMFLPHPGGGTRLDRALEQARAGLGALAGPESADPERWLVFDGLAWVERSEARATGPANPWERADGEPDWFAVDRARTVWVTDRLPERAPRRAAVAHGGGAAVGGPAAVGLRGELLIYAPEGGPLVPARRAAGERTVLVDPALSGAVVELAELWAAQRGLRLVRGVPTEAEAPALTLTLAPASPGGASGGAPGAAPGAAPGGAPGRARRVGRDGWRLDVTPLAAAPELDPPSERAGPRLSPWAWAGDEPMVSAGPGRIELAFQEAEEGDGSDPVAFAVSWAERFDACLLPPSEVVSASERGGAGPAGWRPGSALGPGSGPGSEDEPRSLAALLAAAAALLVGVQCLAGAAKERG